MRTILPALTSLAALACAGAALSVSVMAHNTSETAKRDAVAAYDLGVSLGQMQDVYNRNCADGVAGYCAAAPRVKTFISCVHQHVTSDPKACGEVPAPSLPNPLIRGE